MQGCAGPPRVGSHPRSTTCGPSRLPARQPGAERSNRERAVRHSSSRRWKWRRRRRPAPRDRGMGCPAQPEACQACAAFAAPAGSAVAEVRPIASPPPGSVPAPGPAPPSVPAPPLALSLPFRPVRTPTPWTGACRCHAQHSCVPGDLRRRAALETALPWLDGMSFGPRWHLHRRLGVSRRAPVATPRRPSVSLKGSRRARPP
jgi:hypothetical protein